jgi:glycosyltransferase involved in cell wall biosynthesis
MKGLKQLQAEEVPKMSIVVPTLNEEENIRFLLESIKDQSYVNFETLIIDGGSKDKTQLIACQYNAKVVVLPGQGEFISRNIGAKMARGNFLLFACADIVFPKNTFQRVVEEFEKRPELIALTGPGYHFDASFVGRLEHVAFDFIRYFFSKFPKPLKRFPTSTNFLVVRKSYFDKTGGFAVDDINADGLIGKELLDMGAVAFFPDIYVYASARRMKDMGFFAFHKHYLYALENFFYFFSNKSVLKSWKLQARKRHGKMHEIQRAPRF